MLNHVIKNESTALISRVLFLIYIIGGLPFI